MGKVRKLESARERGRVAAARVPTVEAWLRTWLVTIAGPSVRPKTLAGYRTAVNRHLIPALGGHRLDRLQPAHLEIAYAAMRASGSAAATVHQAHRTLRTALAQAEARGIIRWNPAAVARPPRVADVEIVPLTVAQTRAVLQTCPTVPNGARFALALGLGLRQGEALGVLWSDLDLDPQVGSATLLVRRALQRLIWQHGCPPTDLCRDRRAGACRLRHDGGLALVEPKSAVSRRVVILPEPLVALLRSHRLAQRASCLASGRSWSEHGLVFTNSHGQPIDPRADLAAWKSLLAKAGVPAARLHDARHTAATLLLLQGTDQRTVMAILGWSHSTMAERYQHVLAELRAVAADNLGLLLWPASAIETKTETTKRTAIGGPQAS